MESSNKQIHLMDYLRVLWRRKHVIVLIVLLITPFTIVYSYFMPSLYRTEAVIMPVASGGGGGGRESDLLNAFSFMGIRSGSAELGSVFRIYLESDALKIQVAKALGLDAKFFPSDNPATAGLTEEQKWNMASSWLHSKVTIDNDRLLRSRINISAVAEDPQFATQLARQYLVELQNFITNNALTQAKRQLIFLEKQLAKNKKEMLEMGKTISKELSKPFSRAEGYLDVPVAVYTNEGVRDFKDYEEFRSYFDVLQREGAESFRNEIESVQKVPYQAYQNYMAVQQNVIEYNHYLLTQSYETAKIEAAKQEPSFQILNEPVVPLHRFSPNRRRMAKMAFLISLLVGISWAYFMEFATPLWRRGGVPSSYRVKKMAEEAV